MSASTVFTVGDVRRLRELDAAMNAARDAWHASENGSDESDTLYRRYLDACTSVASYVAVCLKVSA